MLDERSLKLLNEILLSHSVRIPELEEKFHFTRRQIGYSLDKIDIWLETNNLPLLQRTRQAGLRLDPLVREKFPELGAKPSVTSYLPSEGERATLLLVMLLARQEELSLYHLADALKVSRNTALIDLKSASEEVFSSGLRITYSRRRGYFVEGDEFQKRLLLIEAVHKVLAISCGEQLLREVTGLPEVEVERIRRQLEQIEQDLEMRFTDVKWHELPYILALMLRRITKGNLLRNWGVGYHDLACTKEYQIVEHLFPNREEVDEQERLFFTLQILASNVSRAGGPEVQLRTGLLRAIDELLTTFENLVCIGFQDREQLTEKLYVHLKPAYYRVRYGLTTENPMMQEIIREYGDLHQLVKRAVGPVERLFGQPLPDSETAYLTMLIGGWMHKQGNMRSSWTKALVVCPNGISVSRLLFETLRQLFPDIVFLDCVSVRDFRTYRQEYDLVFSTVFVETPKRLFLLKPVLSHQEKLRLKSRVLQEVYGVSCSALSVERLVDLIKPYAEVRNEGALRQRLEDYLRGDPEAPASSVHPTALRPVLSQLVREETVQFASRVSAVEEAIRLAAAPLLEQGAIAERYVEAMIAKALLHEPYIAIAPQVAIPHAGPEDGVNRVAMSLLRLDEPTWLRPDLPIRLLFVIATVDRQAHLQALFQLNELVAEPANVGQMLQAATKAELLTLVELYSQQVVTP